MSKVRFIGLDVHAETIAVAVAQSGCDSEPGGIGTQDDRQAGAYGTSAVLLRGWPHGLFSVLAVDADGGGVRGNRSVAGAVETGRQGQDRPKGCREAGALLSGRRVNAGLGSRRRARRAARSGAGEGSGEERSAASSSPAGKVSAAPRYPADECGSGMDPEVSQLDSDSREVRSACAAGHGGRLPG